MPPKVRPKRNDATATFNAPQPAHAYNTLNFYPFYFLSFFLFLPEVATHRIRTDGAYSQGLENILRRPRSLRRYIL